MRKQLERAALGRYWTLPVWRCGCLPFLTEDLDCHWQDLLKQTFKCRPNATMYALCLLVC